MQSNHLAKKNNVDGSFKNRAKLDSKAKLLKLMQMQEGDL